MKTSPYPKQRTTKTAELPRLTKIVGLMAAIVAIVLPGRAQTADDFVAEGRAFLAARDITNANTRFAAAAALSPTHPTANAFWAATRLMVIANTPTGSGFLDRLGFSANGRNIFAWQSTTPHDASGIPLAPANTSADVLSAFLRTNILTEIAAAETNLANVVDTNFTVTLTGAETGTVSVTLDYGDFRVIESSLKLARYWIYTIYSWNLDSQLADVRTLFTRAATSEGFLRDHPNLFMFATTADMNLARQSFTDAVTEYDNGSDFIRQRPSGTVRLFNLSSTELEAEGKFRQTLADLEQSLNGPVVLTVKTNVSINLGNQLNGLTPPRVLLPELFGNKAIAGTLPDSTFGGVAQGIPRHRAESFLGTPKRNAFAHFPTIPFVSQFQVPSRLPDGTLQLALDALDGSFFIIESSSDLQSWSQVSYGKVSDGLLSFRDNSVNGAHKYYRAVDISADLTINGTIKDIITGQPISNAVVVVYLPDFGVSITNITDNAGNYLIVSPIFDYFTEVIVNAQGFGDFDNWFNPNDQHPLLPIYLAPPGYSPDNDDFANARTLSGATASDSGANIGATFQSNEPLYNGYGETVWWNWTAPSDGAILLDTAGSSFNTSLSVYTGNVLSNLTFIANDIQFTRSHTTHLNFFVTQGTTYRIQVDSADGIPGKIVLNLKPTVPLSPQITSQPRSQVVFPFDDLWLSVSATGTLPLTYQWQKNGTPIPTATDPYLEIFPVSATDSGTYQVIVYNHASFVISSNAVITVSAPQITRQPQSQTIALGEPSFFFVDAAGAETYQWRKDGVDIPLANDFQFNIDAADFPDAGTYTVVLSNAVGTVTSSNAVLAVVVPGPPANDDFTNRMHLTGTSITITATNNYATLEQGEPDTGFGGGGASVWWTWTAPVDGTVSVDAGSDFFLPVVATYTGNSISNLSLIGADFGTGTNGHSVVEFVVNAGQAYQISVDGPSGESGEFTLQISYTPPSPPTIIYQSGIESAFLGDTVDMFAIAIGTHPFTYAWSKNGTLQPAAINQDYIITNVTSADDGTFKVVITNLVGSATSDPIILKVYTNVPPNDNLSNSIAIVGLTNTVYGDNVGASQEAGEPIHDGVGGGRSVWWSWTAPSNGIVRIDTAGSTFDTVLAVYTGNNVSNLVVVAADDDTTNTLTSFVSFFAVAGNAYQIAVDGFSGARGDIVLRVQETAGVAPPQITTQPLSQTISAGGPVTFTVTASGAMPLSYQWRKNSSVISNATNPTYQINNLQAADAGTYMVVITNLYGSVTSSNALLTVNTTGPVNDLFANRITITETAITVNASNVGATKESGEPNHAGNSGGKSVWWTWTAPMTGQVTLDTFGSTFDTLLAVYTGSTVSTLTSVTSDDDYGGGNTSQVQFNATQGVTYQIAVDGYNGASGSVILTLNFVAAAPVPNDMFTNRIVIAGATNSVTGSNIGATKEAGEPNHAGNSGGRSVWWSWQAPYAANVTITTIGSDFDTILGVYTGTAVSALTTVASNDDISGSNRASSVVFAANAGTAYQIAVDGYNGASGNIVLNVQQAPPVIVAPQITNQPQSQIIVIGSNSTFTVGVSGSQPVYQWYASGSPINRATNSNYQQTNAQSTNAGTYFVVVSNSAGTATSANATLTVLAPPPGAWPKSANEWYQLGYTNDGIYPIDPNGTGQPTISQPCLMSVSDGGWTRLADVVASTLLNTNSIEQREYLFVKNGTTLWYRTPITTLIWSWTSGKDLYGTYYYSNGSGQASFTITPSSEHEAYGVGGSSGPGNSQKCLIYSSSCLDAPNAQVQLCQDSPGIFGASCQCGVTVYLRESITNHPPVGNNDSYVMSINTSLNVPFPGVLLNDTDSDGDSLSAVLVTGPSHGTLTFNLNGSFSYTPASNFTGTDSFVYEPNDGQTNGNATTVTITIH